MNISQISKYLSYILRHKPESIGLMLDINGWANIDELISKTKEFVLTKEMLQEIVKTSDKQRFIIKDDKIRANQGHSIDIDLNVLPTNPPSVLYHGTVIKNVDVIMQEGIKSMSRHYVHLSADKQTAINVGKRHGKPIVMQINSQAMSEDGYKFYLSENNVWLTDYIPPKYIVT